MQALASVHDMSHSDYDDLRPDRVREVEVLVDGEWLLGDLEATDKLDGVWRGRVRYSRGPWDGQLPRLVL